MKVLVWVPPWIVDGNPHFHEDAARNYLVPQANLLASTGVAVDLALPSTFAKARGKIEPGVNVRLIDPQLQHQLGISSNLDPSADLYRGTDSQLVDRVQELISPHLGPDYDAIVVWETPAPYLQSIFPEALIVHQMPGAFSRPPYPPLLQFDPIGLYRSSSLCRFADAIKARSLPDRLRQTTHDFADKARLSLLRSTPFSVDELVGSRSFKKLALLPLQTSNHFNLRVDTTYDRQADFLIDVLKATPAETGVVVTQYLGAKIRERVLSSLDAGALQKTWPNLIYCERFDSLPSVSQYLLPLVSEVITCSSSLGIQAMLFAHDLRVPQATYLAPYDSGHCQTSLECHTPTEWSAVCTSTIAHVLATQPLASMLTTDGPFVVNLLEEMISRKRSGAHELELLPDLTSLFPDYAERLARSFREDDADKSLVRAAFPPSPRARTLQKFREALGSPSRKAIFFDVFGTLIRRPFESQEAEYGIIEALALREFGYSATDFRYARRAAEHQVQAERPDSRVTIENIYASLQQKLSLAPETTQRLLELELRMNVELSSTRPLGRALWTEAKRRGVPLYLISDGYLPDATVREILLLHDYVGSTPLISGLSSKGALTPAFSGVLQELGLTPDEVLHVTSARHSNAWPTRSDTSVFRLPDPIASLHANQSYRTVYPPRIGSHELARSAIVALTAHTLFDSIDDEPSQAALFGGRPENLGYAAVGPLLTGFALWLHREAVERDISHLYFLSREGHLFREAFGALTDALPARRKVPSTYLRASRRASRVAALTRASEVSILATQPFTPGATPARMLLDRFGYQLQAADLSALSAHGFADPDAAIPSGRAGALMFERLCSELSPKLLISAAKERDGYLEYLQTKGLGTERRPAVVDVGWGGNIQSALGKLTGRSLIGFYLATFEGIERKEALGERCLGYFGNGLSKAFPSNLLRQRHVIEYLLCSTEASLICFASTPDGVAATYQTTGDSARRTALIRAIHYGAMSFVVDFAQVIKFSGTPTIIDPFLAGSVLSCFIERPAPADAALLAGHTFDDALNGVDGRALLGRGAYAPEHLAVPGSVRCVTTRTATSWLLVHLESRLARIFLPRAKHGKYLANRARFFADSRLPLARAWYRWSSKAE